MPLFSTQFHHLGLSAHSFSSEISRWSQLLKTFMRASSGNIMFCHNLMKQSKWTRRLWFLLPTPYKPCNISKPEHHLDRTQSNLIYCYY